MKNSMSNEKIQYQSELLINRVKKNYNHLKKRFARAQIDCFRLYDWDIPEIRAVVDWYKGHIVVAEYVRTQTTEDWLPAMAKAVAIALDIPANNTHVKRRQTKTENGPRYQKLDSKGERFVVNERDLKFWVNLDDFLDTGLFSDHRDTREIIKKISKDKNFLNLFAYTGAFTCAAALGGAKSTTTVDRSDTYLNWAKENLQLNALWSANHKIVQSDSFNYLQRADSEKKRFNLAVVDPPSFFQDNQRKVSFDIDKDHPKLLDAVLKVMEKDSEVYFSTNHQNFTPKFESLTLKNIVELTPKTIPEDYRNKKIHRCWKIITV